MFCALDGKGGDHASTRHGIFQFFYIAAIFFCYFYPKNQQLATFTVMKEDISDRIVNKATDLLTFLQ